jgi:hypothetical protein
MYGSYYRLIINKSLNESVVDKIRKYRTDYNNNPLRLSLLVLLLPVRLGGYTVTLWDFYSHRLIGKLTAFLQNQEFNWHNMTVDLYLQVFQFPEQPSVFEVFSLSSHRHSEKPPIYKLIGKLTVFLQLLFYVST